MWRLGRGGEVMVIVMVAPYAATEWVLSCDSALVDVPSTGARGSSRVGLSTHWRAAATRI